MTRFATNAIMSLVHDTPRHDLGESVSPLLQLDDLQADFPELTLGYGTTAGSPALRAAIAASNGASPEEVVVTVGGMHALFMLAFVLLSPGDEAVTVSPLFPMARNALDVVGADVRVLPLTFDDGYELDPARLRTYLSPSTKLVSLASPQNPSGVALSLNVVEEILAVMASVCPDAYLLVDETYREATYGSDPVARSAVALSSKVISVASLSKCHGAAGLRIGWATSRDPALIDELLLAKFNTVVTCSPVTEALALQVVSRSEEILAVRRESLAASVSTIERWVSENSDFVEWVRPDAGAICCVRLKPAAFDDVAVENFYRTLAENGVRVSNGSWFGDESRVFRLGFGYLPEAELKAALDALAAALPTHLPA
jgi:aspartate/methionine/tyrosine aminotransferase